MQQTLVVRFSEVTLKGRNRNKFENRMARNIGQHLKAQGSFQLVRRHARMEIGGGDLRLAAEIVRGLPGVANVSVGHRVSRDLPALEEAGVTFFGELLARHELRARQPDNGSAPATFGVEVERKDKRYPLRSMEIAAKLGQAILGRFPALRVNLSQPDLQLCVEIVEDGALLFEEKLPGPGGLAVGSSGKAICLLSGGIDSPVAAYQMMTRGVTVVHLNFHSYPFIGEQSREKVLELVRFLARYQPHSRVHIAPFAEIQTAIRDHCPENLRTLLYRRFMDRVANLVAEQEGALALVTGESVGQVASQTLENLRGIHAVATVPVMQPLIGMAKSEIIDRARRIGTYPISIQPYPDCCTLFQPAHPETHATLAALERAEAPLPVDDLVRACVAGLDTVEYGPEYWAAWPS